MNSIFLTQANVFEKMNQPKFETYIANTRPKWQEAITQCTKGRLKTKWGRWASLMLMVAILATIPLNNNFICMELDGTTSIENTPLGTCHSMGFDSVQNENQSDHQNSKRQAHCTDCTDSFWLQNLSTKLQNDATKTGIQITALRTSIRAEVFIDTKLIVSDSRHQKMMLTKRHNQLQTTRFLI